MQNSEYYIYIKASENHLRFDVGLAKDILKMLLAEKSRRRLLSRGLGVADAEPNWKLVYYEHGHSLATATSRCQRLLRLPPSKRNALIDRHNPGWHDLGVEWFREI